MDAEEALGFLHLSLKRRTDFRHAFIHHSCGISNTPVGTLPSPLSLHPDADAPFLTTHGF